MECPSRNARLSRCSSRCSRGTNQPLSIEACSPMDGRGVEQPTEPLWSFQHLMGPATTQTVSDKRQPRTTPTLSSTHESNRRPKAAEHTLPAVEHCRRTNKVAKPVTASTAANLEPVLLMAF